MNAGSARDLAHPGLKDHSRYRLVADGGWRREQPSRLATLDRAGLAQGAP